MKEREFEAEAGSGRFLVVEDLKRRKRAPGPRATLLRGATSKGAAPHGSVSGFEASLSPRRRSRSSGGCCGGDLDELPSPGKLRSEETRGWGQEISAPRNTCLEGHK